MTTDHFVVWIGRVNIFEIYYNYVALTGLHKKNDCLDASKNKILQTISLMYLFFYKGIL
jgi:hypothetical protein